MWKDVRFKKCSSNAETPIYSDFRRLEHIPHWLYVYLSTRNVLQFASVRLCFPLSIVTLGNCPFGQSPTPIFRQVAVSLQPFAELWSHTHTNLTWMSSSIKFFSLSFLVLFRTWCELAVPFWTPAPKTTGSKSSGQKVAPHSCFATLRTMLTRWPKTSEKPTSNPSPLSLKTWVSAGTVFRLHTCTHTCHIFLSWVYFPIRSLFFCSTVLTVDYLDVSDPEKATLPRFKDIQESYPRELGSSVHFPLFNLRDHVHKGNCMVQIRTVPPLLF